MKLSYFVYNESLALEDFNGAVFTCANFQKTVQMGFSLNEERKRTVFGVKLTWVSIRWIFGLFSKLYIPSTLNITLIQWHTQLNVCAVK